MMPIKMSMKNFQMFDDAEIDFSFSSALVVGERDGDPNKSNGAGKTSLLDAITWALFGKSKHKNIDSVVKRTRDTCEVNLSFEHDGSLYRIERRRNSKYSRMDINFYKVVDGAEVSQQGDTNKDIDSKVREVLGTNFDVFLSSSYFRQSSVSSFMSSTTADRQKLVGSMLNLDRWNKKMELAKVKLADANRDVDNLSFKLNEMGDLDSELENSSVRAKDVQEELSRLKNGESRINAELMQLDGRVNDLRLVNTRLVDYHESITQRDSLEEKLTELAATLQNRAVACKGFEDQIARNTSDIGKLEIKIEELGNNLGLRDSLNIAALEQSLVRAKVKISAWTAEIKAWEPDLVCPCCSLRMHTHTDKVAAHNQRVEDLKLAESKLRALNGKISVTKDELEKISAAESEIEKYSQRIGSCRSSIELDGLRLTSLLGEVNSIKNQMQEREVELSRVRSKLDGMDDIEGASSYDELIGLVQTKRDELKANEARHTDLVYEKGALTQKLSRLSIDMQDRDDSRGKLESARHLASVFTNISKAFGRTGIQAVIIDNVVDEWMRAANGWLERFCYDPTYIKIITQKQDTKGSWKEAFDIEVHTTSGVSDFDSLSGGEQFRVAFAMRVSLAQVQASRMGGQMQMLLLDEVSTALDREGRDMFVSLIKVLEREMKVLVITHDDHLKEEFDHIITVKRSGNDSVIVV